MSVASKTKAVLNIAERKPSELAECLGVPVQSVRNKFSRDVFSVSDLLRIFDFLGCKMYVEFPDGQRVAYTISDAKLAKKSERSEDPDKSIDADPEHWRSEPVSLSADQEAELKSELDIARSKGEAVMRELAEQESPDRIDCDRLKNDVAYRSYIEAVYGADILAEKMGGGAGA